MINETSIRYFLGLFTHIKPEMDQELVILKSHLAIEQLARDFVTTKVRNYRHIESANLRFYQLINLARALDPLDTEMWAWEGSLQLNSIRNALFHQLKVTDLDNRINKFIAFVDSHGQIYPEVETHYGLISRIASLWTSLCVALHFEPENVRRKSILNPE